MTSPTPPALAGNLALLEQGLRLLNQLTQDRYRATVHHFAVIRLLLPRQGSDGDPGLGVAPSTTAHEAAAR